MSKLTVSMCVLALILFFLPWVNVSCDSPQGKETIVKQSGVQIMYGGVSVPNEMRQLEQLGGGAGETEGDDVSFSILTTLAFLAVLGSVIIGVCVLLRDSSVRLSPSLARFIDGLGRKRAAPGVLAGIAFLLLALNMIIGFPVERSVDEQIARADVPAPAYAYDPQMTVPQQTIVTRGGLEVDYRWPLYIEMAALAVPVLLLLNNRYHWITPRQDVTLTEPGSEPRRVPPEDLT